MSCHHRPAEGPDIGMSPSGRFAAICVPLARPALVGGMPRCRLGSGETLLHALVHKRRLTVPETLKVLQRRADRMSEPGFALSDRQFRRWLAGDISSLDGARPANVRVAEAEFGWSIEADLLAADERQLKYPMPLTQAVTQRKLHTDEFISWITAHSSLMYEAA